MGPKATGEPFAARPFDFRRYSDGVQILLPEDPIFQARIGWLRPQPQREEHSGPKLEQRWSSCRCR